jgi:putative ABC transport system ATP-binding protein
MIQTNNLTFRYDGMAQFQFPDMDCKQGSHWLILGQSGCGKSTLLHLLGGLLQPTGGRIVVKEEELTALQMNELDYFRGQNIGIVFQQSHLIKALTIEENLLTAQYLAGMPQDKEVIHTLLDRLNIGDKANEKPQQLSLGERQRASIARALVNQPALILADEPTSSLDDVNCQEVVNLLLEQSKNSNATLIIVTHDQRLKALFQNKILLSEVKKRG